MTSALIHLIYGLALNACLLATVAAVQSRLGRPDPAAESPDPARDIERLLTFMLLRSALVVLIVSAAGTAGWLDLRGIMLAFVVALGLLAHAAGPGGLPGGLRRDLDLLRELLDALGRLAAGALSSPRTRLGLALVLLPGTLLLADRAVLPPVAWDALTYHLRYPVLWLQDGHLATPAEPFGDISPTYYPLAGQMIFYFGLLSTGSDLWSVLFQLPPALMGFLALIGIGLKLGARPRHAALAGLLWLGTPALLRQAVEPAVDVVQAAFLLTTVFLLLQWRSDGRHRSVLLAAVAAGLAVGTKYTSLPYLLAMLPLAIGILSRRPPGGGRRLDGRTGLSALLLILLLGGYTYLRNLVAGGNPLLPMTVAVGGIKLLPGIAPMSDYFGSARHELRLLDFLFSRRTFLDAGPAFLLLLALPPVMTFRRRRSDPDSIVFQVSLAALLALLIYVVLVPYRGYRHILFFTGLAAALIGVAAHPRRPALAVVRLVPWILALSLPAMLFYWAKELILNGLKPHHALALGLVVGLLLALTSPGRTLGAGRRLAAWGASSRRRAWAAVGAGGVVLLLVLAAVQTWYTGHKYSQWEAFWTTRRELSRGGRLRQDYAEAALSWRLVADRTLKAPAVVAYAGTNIPYPLTGYDLRNRVLFVPRNGRWRDIYYDWGGRPLEATVGGSRDAWLENVARLGVTYLCVYRQSPENDPLTRFPVEEEWARSAPERFCLIHSEEWVRVYEVIRGD